MSMKKRIKTALIITGFSLIFMTALTFTLLQLIDTEYMQKNISKRLNDILSQGVKIESIDFAYFPAPYIQLKQIAVNRGESRSIIINSAMIYPDIFHLIKGRLVIKDIKIKGVLANIPIPLMLFSEKPANKAHHKLPDWIFSKTNPEKTIFHIFHGEQPDFSMKISDIQIESFPSARASINISPENSSIWGNFQISNFEINKKDHEKYLAGTTIEKFSSKKISLKFKYEPLNTIEVHGSMASPGLEWKGKEARMINADAISFSISKHETKTKISILPFNIDPSYATLWTDFSHDEKTGQMTLIFQGSDIMVDKAGSAALDLLKENKICKKIFDIIKGGKVPHVTVSFQGSSFRKLFDAKQMYISGQMEEGIIKIPGTGLVVTDVHGSASVEKGVLHTDVFKGALSASRLEKGILDVHILEKKIPFKGLFFLTADLSQLKNVLVDLLPATRLAAELGLTSNIKGEAKGILGLKKNNKELLVTVQADDIRLSGKYERLPHKLEIYDGKFNYKDNKADIKDMDGTLGASSFSDISFSFDFIHDNILEILSGKALFDVESVFPWLLTLPDVKKLVSPLSSMGGNIRLDSINFKGPVKDTGTWNYLIKGRCDDLTLFIYPELSKIEKQASSLSFDFIHSEMNTSMSTINGIFHDTALISTMTLNSDLEQLARPFTLEDAGIKKNKAGIQFNGALKFKNGVKIIADIEKTPQSLMVNQLNIVEKNISDMMLSYNPGTPLLPFRFRGKVRISTIEKLLQAQSPLSETLISITNGNDFTLSTQNNSDITVSTETLSLEFMLEQWHKLQKSSKNPSLQDIEPISSVKYSFPYIITLACNELQYKSLKLSPFKAHIALNDKNSTIVIVDHAKFCNIKATGLISIEKNTMEISISIDDKDLDINELLECLYGKTGLLKGRSAIKANLFTSGGFTSDKLIDKEKNSLKNNFNGNLQFNSDGGRIFRLTLLSRILSVINISRLLEGKLPDIEQNGFAFDKIEISADVEKSKINLTDAVIKGLDMTLIFRGWIDPLQNEMNLTCLVAPFKTADIIIEKIPILGTMLNNQLISIPVQISGSVDNPDVTPLPPAAVGKGLINTMQNILTTPFKLIDKLP